jgi:outer membrane protein TolC
MFRGTLAIALGVTMLVSAGAHAQTPTPQTPTPQPPTPQTATPPTQAAASRTPAVAERITFKEAVDRALARNLTIQQAATDILRADALIRQARSVLFPNASGNITTR